MLSRFSPPLVFGFLVGLVAACALFAALGAFRHRGGGDRSESVTRLRIAHSQPATHPVHAGIVHLAERAAALSGGRLVLEVYPNGQLGNETQTLEQVQAGSLAIAKVGSAPLVSFLDTFKLFSLPFVFRDEAHFWSVLEGPLGEELLEALALTNDGRPSGFQGLTYYDAGSRNFYVRRPVAGPADLAGLKIRVQDDPVAMDMVAALGGAPTPIPFGELYTSLQQGVVDGAENNPPSFVASRHYEVCDHFVFSHHSRNPDVLVISSRVWAGLSARERSWLQQAANDSRAVQRAAWRRGMDEALVTMREKGVTVHHPDLTPFVAATESVRARHATGPLADLLARVLATTATATATPAAATADSSAP